MTGATPSPYRQLTSEVGAAAGEDVFDDHDCPAFGEKSIAEMGSEKADADGNYSALGTHAFLPFFRTAAGTQSG